MPTDIETTRPTRIDQSGVVGRERGKRGLDRHAASRPRRDADRAAQERQRHRLGQELQDDVAPERAHALRTPISRVRSVTDTSMMFITPTPPIRSEIAGDEDHRAARCRS